MKKLLLTIKKIKRLHILAALFLAFIFYVGMATLPATMKNIGAFVRGGEGADINSIASEIDFDYFEMLDFMGYNFQNKGVYINLNGLMARIMGQRLMNERIKLDNGHLTYTFWRTDATRGAEQLTKLYEKQKENGKEFLFVLTPYQVSKYEDLMPPGYEDWGNENADDLADMLTANGVPVLDLRDVMRDEGMSYSDTFFVTDNHWKTETGFWAYATILERLAQGGAIETVDAKYTDIENFDLNIYHDWFLGSHGKRTGIYYAGLDDIAIIEPKFESDISLSIPSHGIYKSGDFYEVTYNEECLIYDYYLGSAYEAYGFGNRDQKRYENEGAPLDLKLMTIGDSFNNVPAALYPLVFKTCDVLDMRHWTRDFAGYYAEFDPDIIIVMFSPSEVKEKNATFDFFNDL